MPLRLSYIGVDTGWLSEALRVPVPQRTDWKCVRLLHEEPQEVSHMTARENGRENESANERENESLSESADASSAVCGSACLTRLSTWTLFSNRVEWSGAECGPRGWGTEVTLVMPKKEPYAYAR
jgi:hypothetical protein